MTGAYAFCCKCANTDALLLRLNELAVWQWRQGDSYWYGDYVTCSPFPGVRIRICDFPGKRGDEYVYDSDVRRSKDCSTPMEEIDQAYRKVLEQLPATDVHEIDWFD